MKKLWSIKFIPIVDGTFGLIQMNLEKRLGVQDIKGRIETNYITKLLKVYIYIYIRMLLKTYTYITRM